MDAHVEPPARQFRPADALRVFRERLADGDIDAAADIIRDAAVAHPNHSGVLVALGEITLRRGDVKTAASLAERVVELAPSAAHYAHLATLRMRLGNPAGAEAAALAGHAAFPDDVSLMLRLSDLAARRQDFAAMLGWAERAAEVRPQDVEAHLHLAHWHMQLGNFGGAWDALNEAGVRQPDDPLRMRRASGLAARQGDLSQAFYWLERAIAARPGEAAAYGDLATLHIHAGNLAQAAAAVQQGLALAPNDAGLQRRRAYLHALRDRRP